MKLRHSDKRKCRKASHGTNQVSRCLAISIGRLLPLLFVLVVDDGVGAAECAGEKMTVIYNAADKLCGIVNEAGEARGIAVRGKIDAELNGLAKKLGVGLSGSGAGDFTSESYKGVLRGQLEAELHDIRSCRLHIYDSLVIRLCPPAAPVPVERAASDMPSLSSGSPIVK
jgi:hypothetical protein